MEFATYVHNNPINHIDPLGLAGLTPEQAIAEHDAKQCAIEANYNSWPWLLQKLADAVGWHSVLKRMNDEALEKYLADKTGLSSRDQAKYMVEIWARQIAVQELLKRTVGGLNLTDRKTDDEKTDEHPEQTKGNRKSKLTDEQKKKYPRYSYSKKWKEELKEYHRGPDGKLYDPSGVEIKPGEPIDVGHSGRSYDERVREADSNNMSEDDWYDQEHDPRNFRPELPRHNSSNQFQEWTTPNEPAVPGVE